MRLQLTILSTFVIVIGVFGQYNITTNESCITALKEKTLKGDPLLNTAINFMKLARTNNYIQWVSLLSEDCRFGDPHGISTRKWWDYLSDNNKQFEIIAEQPTRLRDNKTVYFKTQSDNKSEKIIRLILVKEGNEWKVLSVEL